MTSPTDLEKLARAATPGPWEWRETFVLYAPKANVPRMVTAMDPKAGWSTAAADAQFIAACDPTTIHQLLADRRELVKLVMGFVETVAAAERNNERRGQGGQQVPFHGDFCNAPPSVMSRLSWWARELQALAASMGET